MTAARRAGLVLHIAAATLIASCASGSGGAHATSPTQGAAPNTLTAAERAAGWRLLFDGTSAGAWRGYKEAALPAGWTIADGTLAKDAATNDLVTREEFADFELRFDWKLGRGGNAGVFYRATEEYDHVYWSGPEYQLLDDANHPDGRSRLTSAGAAYGLYPSPAGIVEPADEWNSSRILVRGSHVEHWLNGRKLLEYELGGADWSAKVKASKFGAWAGYGKAARGRIGIQGDHGGALALRNISIRELR